MARGNADRLIGAVLGIVGIEAFWRFFACGSI
jgi:hypothetical protein